MLWEARRPGHVIPPDVGMDRVPHGARSCWSWPEARPPAPSPPAVCTGRGRSARGRRSGLSGSLPCSGTSVGRSVWAPRSRRQHVLSSRRTPQQRGYRRATATPRQLDKTRSSPPALRSGLSESEQPQPWQVDVGSGWMSRFLSWSRSSRRSWASRLVNPSR